MPLLLNKHRDPPGDAIYIGRGSPWGNPYKRDENNTKEDVIKLHTSLVLSNPAMIRDIHKLLRGNDLICFCSPLSCHGDLLLSIANEPMFDWSADMYAGYEVTSKADSRFSALFARLSDGRTIEEAYQLDIKGYRSRGNDWRLGKGRPPLRDISSDLLYRSYYLLWKRWSIENPKLIHELYLSARPTNILVDRFAKTPINQAKALSQVLNETYW